MLFTSFSIDKNAKAIHGNKISNKTNDKNDKNETIKYEIKTHYRW